MLSVLVSLCFDRDAVICRSYVLIFHGYGQREWGAAPFEFCYPVDYFIRFFPDDEAFSVEKNEQCVGNHLNFFDKVAIEILFFACDIRYLNQCSTSASIL